MLGNIVILTISWVVLRWKQQDLRALMGSSFTYRLLQLIAGFIASAFLAGVVGIIFAFSAGFNWEPMAGLGVMFLLKSFYKAFNNVLYEELLFRGVLLYLAIRWLGEKRAILLSAFAFGIYHWFTFSTFGNPAFMIWILLYTGLWGLMFAYAFSRTGSLALPIGLHLGWYFVDRFIFNAQGGSLFVAVSNIHTRYLSTLETMLYLRLPAIAFAVVVIVLLCHFVPHQVVARAKQHTLK